MTIQSDMLMLHDSLDKILVNLDAIHDIWPDMDEDRYKYARNYILRAYNILTPVVWKAPPIDII